MAEALTAQSPIRVSQRELIELSQVARGLSLEHLRIKASSGGSLRSSLLGRGMEFDEARPYQPGDEPRNIDWRITARTGKPYTKIFREERERPVIVFVDLRAAMHFATVGNFKAVQAARLATLLSWIAFNHGDRVGGFLFSENFHRELKPQLGKRGSLRLIHELVSAPVWQPESADAHDAAATMSKALSGLRTVARSGSLVTVFTDGRNFDEAAFRQLKGLARHNDIVVFHIFDPLEAELPPPGRYQVMQGNVSRTLRSEQNARRLAHKHAFQALVARLKSLSTGSRLRYVAVSTADDAGQIARDIFSKKQVR